MSGHLMTLSQSTKEVLQNLSPEQVQDLDDAGSRELARIIREFLIETVSETGGHLGANLGVIELTIALHRHFPVDTQIIYDTGHQAYTHKIITGRAGLFPTLRQRNGLSGFPSRAESEHDLLENSHASVGAGWAYGVCLARNTRTVVVLGDGALTGGVAFEALHALGVRAAPVTVIYNDNGRSYAPTTSSLTLGDPDDGEYPVDRTEDFANALGLRYFGPVDGHDLTDLRETLSQASVFQGPTLIHARTKKGYGWLPAREDPIKRLHDVSGAADSKKPAGTKPQVSWGKVLSDTLCDMAASDPRIHVITAAMPDTLALLDFKGKFPERFHDVGICEQLAITLAAGLASQGARPIVPIVSTFATRALDQMMNDVALHSLPVTIVLDRAGITGRDGPSHHGVYDVGFLRTVPGLHIYSPSTAAQLEQLLRQQQSEQDHPVVIRYPKESPRLERAGETTAPSVSVPPTVKLAEGPDICLLTHGVTTAYCLEAVTTLARDRGLEASLWECTRVHPVDQRAVADALDYPAVLIVEELSAGTGLTVDFCRAAAASHRAPQARELALPPAFMPWGSRAELLEEYGMTVATIAEHASALCAATDAR